MKGSVVPVREHSTGRRACDLWYFRVPCDCPSLGGYQPVWPVDRIARSSGYEPTQGRAMTVAADHIKRHHRGES